MGNPELNEKGINDEWIAPTTGGEVRPDVEKPGMMRKIEDYLSSANGRWILPAVGITAMFMAGMTEKANAAGVSEKARVVDSAGFWYDSLHSAGDKYVDLELTCPQTTDGYAVKRNEKDEIVLPSKMKKNSEIWAEAVRTEDTWANKMNTLVSPQEVTKAREAEEHNWRVKIQTLLKGNQKLANGIMAKMGEFKDSIFNQSPKTGKAFIYHDEPSDFSRDDTGVKAVLVEAQNATLQDDENTIVRYGIGEELAHEIRQIPDGNLRAKTAQEIFTQGTREIEYGIQTNMAIVFQERNK